MPLKIIGAGFGRTGTSSLHAALNLLGLPCYHMVEVIENPANKSHLDFWCDVANGEAGEQYDWEQIFADYTAAIDNPACCVWRELLAAYPEAKVVLTLHPAGADAWYESTVETIYFTETLWQFKVLELVTPFGRKMGEMSRKLIWQRSHKGTMRDRAKAIDYYHQHIADVTAAVPADRLLVYSVDQGWKPLCDFLDLPEPAGAFPNINDRATMKRRIGMMTRAAYAILGLGAAVFAGIIYGLIAVGS
jgi:hypothetical protein